MLPTELTNQSLIPEPVADRAGRAGGRPQPNTRTLINKA